MDAILRLDPGHWLDLERGIVHVDGDDRKLSRLERVLLRVLVDAQGATRPRSALVVALWGKGRGAHKKDLDGVVRRLRQRLERNPLEPRYLQTVVGDGFRLLLAAPQESPPQVVSAEPTLLRLHACAVDVDAARYEGFRSGDLTPIEVAVLRRLAQTPGRPVSSAVLAREVWGARSKDYRMVAASIKRLRSKIELDPKRPRSLVSVRSMGVALRLAGHQVGGNSPLPGTSFVGREAERLQLVGELTAGGLVTVVGPAGVGKTRLASVVAAELAEAGARSVLLVDLVFARTDDEVWLAVGRALRLSAGLDHSRVALALDTHVRPLLVLDNADDAVGPAGRAVQKLREGRDLAVLVTSREPLDVPGEKLLGLEPLGPRDALTLYRQRGGGARGPEGVASLGGLPLAIELAASGPSGGLGPSVGLGGLTDLIGASWARLDPTLQAALAALAPFGEAFDEKLAQDAIGAEGRRALQALLRKSLVQRLEDAERPFRLLPPVRSAIALLAGDLADALAIERRAMRAFVLPGIDAVLEMKRTAPSWRTRSSDLGRILEVALSSDWIEEAVGAAAMMASDPVSFAVASDALRRVMARLPEDDLVSRVGLGVRLARVAVHSGSYDSARDQIAVVRQWLGELPNTLAVRSRGLLHDLDGAIETRSGTHQRAMEAFASAEAAFLTVGDVEDALVARSNALGESVNAGHLSSDSAVAGLESALHELGSMGAPRVRRVLLRQIATQQLRMGDPVSALARLEESLPWSQGIPSELARLWQLVGIAKFESGDARSAIANFRASYQCTSEVGLQAESMTALGNIGRAQIQSGRQDVGRATLLRVIEQAKATGFAGLAAAGMAEVAQHDLARGDVEAAIAGAEGSVALLAGLNALDGAQARVILARALLAAGRFADAAQEVAEVGAVLEALEVPPTAHVWKDWTEVKDQLAKHVSTPSPGPVPS